MRKKLNHEKKKKKQVNQSKKNIEWLLTLLSDWVKVRQLSKKNRKKIEPTEVS